MDTQPRIAVVGAGQWGMNHVRAWARLGHLHAVADADPLRLAAVRRDHPDVLTVPTVAELVDRDDVDAVVVAGPAALHAEHAVAALRAGKDVLVEKPLAVDVGEARAILAAAAAAGRQVMVGHLLEYHPAFLRLRELADAGDLGRIRYAYSHRLNFGRVRTEENALWSFAPHDLALMGRLLGAPVEVSCGGGAYLSAGVADLTLLTLRFTGDVHAHVFVSWLHPFKDQRFVVVAEGQMAVFDDTAPWEEKLLLYPHTVRWDHGTAPVAEKARALPVPLTPYEPLLAECEEFLDALRTGRPPLTDGASGLAVLEVLAAAQRSLNAGGVPTFPPEPPPEPPRAPAAGLVHPTATVDPGAKIGPGTRVWHYTHVTAGAEVGRDCVLGQNVYVAGGVRIGDGVRIQNNVSVYDGVTLEDGVFCGPSVVFTNVRTPRAGVDRRAGYLPTVVRRGATLGANSTLVCGVTVGAGAFVAAGAVVTRDVPAYTVVAGVPARPTGLICGCGAELVLGAGVGAICEPCGDCGRAYRRTERGVAEALPPPPPPADDDVYPAESGLADPVGRR